MLLLVIFLFLIKKEVLCMQMFQRVKRIMLLCLTALGKLHCLNCRVLRLSKHCPLMKQTQLSPEQTHLSPEQTQLSPKFNESEVNDNE